jgi:hypothetical protein
MIVVGSDKQSHYLKEEKEREKSIGRRVEDRVTGVGEFSPNC